MQCFQGAHNAAHSVIGAAVDHRIQMGAAGNRGNVRIQSRTAKEQIPQYILPYFQVQVLDLFQQPHLGRFVRAGIGQTGNARFRFPEFGKAADELFYTIFVYR